MKHITAFLIVACMLLSVTALAQQVTFSKRNATIDDIRKVLEKQAGYTILTQNEISSQLKPANIHINNGAVKELLDEFFRYQPCTYTIIGNAITIVPRDSQSPSANKKIDIRGRISNEQGEPIPGATITVKGSNQQTSTDGNGQFKLTGVNEINLNIVVTSINYESEEVSWQGETELNVQLKQHISELSKVQVVSTGYQKVTKEKSPGSFTKIDNELLNRRVSTNIIDRLEGITSGLTFNKNINPNANQSALSIRGRSTIYANPNPLIVIDNFPYTGDINNINPNDVESITVLKDADAASIWGAFSGNGVIVITTKKGKYNQPLKLAFNSNVTVGAKPDLYYTPTLNSSDYVDVEQYLFNLGFYNSKETSQDHPVVSPAVDILFKKRNGAISPTDAEDQLNQLRGQDKRNDLSKYFYRSSIYQQYAVSASGGSNINNYYLSAGYDKNLENLVRNQYDRITLTANNSFTWLKKRLEVNTGIIYTESKLKNNSTANSSVIYPYSKLVDDNGNAITVPRDLRQGYKDTIVPPGNNTYGLLNWDYKPYDELKLSDNVTKATDYRINADIKYAIFKWLDVTALYQYNKGYTEQENYQSPESYFARNYYNQFTEVNATNGIIHHVPPGGILDQGTIRNEVHNIRSQLNYNYNWYNRNHSKHHQVTAMAGAEVRSLQSRSETLRFYGYNKVLQTSGTVNYDSTFPLFYSPTATRKIDYYNFNKTTTDRYISYYLNAKYIFQRRYILSASARKDESNLFGVSTNQKGVPLWSVGASWEMNQENFYHIGWLPLLKLRVTNGYNGNVDKTVSAYTTAQIDASRNIWQELTATIINPPNPSLRWEKNHMVNFGVDFAIKNSIIEGSLEYYLRRGIDLIGNSPLDPTTGVTTFRGNTADMKGRGVDITLQSKNINKQFKWFSTLLFSYNTDKVTNYKVPQSAIWYYCDPQFISPIAGKPLYSIYSFKWMGLAPQTGDPQGYFEKQVTTEYSKIINSTDLSNLVYRGPANPTYFGSLRNNLSYKQLELSFNITWKFGYYFRRSSINYYDLFTNAPVALGHPDYEKRWQRPGDELYTNVPSVPVNVNDANRSLFYTNSDILIEKGDHIRLQDIQLSYLLNKKEKTWLPVNQVRFYLYANNLGILWRANDKGIDPDYLLPSVMPNPRTIAAGFKIDF